VKYLKEAIKLPKELAFDICAHNSAITAKGLTLPSFKWWFGSIARHYLGMD
jgi:hypothetical protein